MQMMCLFAYEMERGNYYEHILMTKGENNNE